MSNRDQRLMVIMSVEEKNALRKAAQEAGITMSSFLRQVIKSFIKNGKSVEDEI